MAKYIYCLALTEVQLALHSLKAALIELQQYTVYLSIIT
jgi:hypothetical protein